MDVLRCPTCWNQMTGADINLKTEVAMCRACERLWPRAGIVRQPAIEPDLLANPPRGCRVETSGGEIAFVFDESRWWGRCAYLTLFFVWTLLCGLSVVVLGHDLAVTLLRAAGWQVPQMWSQPAAGSLPSPWAAALFLLLSTVGLTFGILMLTAGVSAIRRPMRVAVRGQGRDAVFDPRDRIFLRRKLVPIPISAVSQVYVKKERVGGGRSAPSTCFRVVVRAEEAIEIGDMQRRETAAWLAMMLSLTVWPEGVTASAAPGGGDADRYDAPAAAGDVPA